jgi:glutamyl-tRNA synthetase
LAKREADLSLAELRDRGCDPRAVVAWVARSAGMDLGDRITAREATPHFDLARLPRESVVLGQGALNALTG